MAGASSVRRRCRSSSPFFAPVTVSRRRSTPSAFRRSQVAGGLPCRVRMGLHTGEPSLNDEGYHGIALHRGARIADAGHGGQVLLSSATAELVQDDLPAGVALLGLGEHRLKDIDRPERLYQLVVDGLRSEFPPPRTLISTATSLMEARVARPARTDRRRRVGGRAAGGKAESAACAAAARGGAGHLRRAPRRWALGGAAPDERREGATGIRL